MAQNWHSFHFLPLVCFFLYLIDRDVNCTGGCFQWTDTIFGSGPKACLFDLHHSSGTFSRKIWMYMKSNSDQTFQCEWMHIFRAHPPTFQNWALISTFISSMYMYCRSNYVEATSTCYHDNKCSIWKLLKLHTYPHQLRSVRPMKM